MYEDLRGLPFSIKLQTLRYRKGLTQKSLAGKIGCSGVTVSLWESDKCFPAGFLLEKLRQFYGLPLDFFTEDKIKALKLSSKKRKV